MSSPSPTGANSSTSPSFVPKCSLCDHSFTAEECFFCCFPCESNGFNVCQTCVLTDTFTPAGHDPRPCFLDLRDDRPTFFPAPKASDLGSLISSIKENAPSGIPRDAKKFLSRSKIGGISEQRLTSRDAGSQYDTSDATSILHTVPNNYSLYEKLDPALRDIRIFKLLRGSPQDPVTVILGRFSFPWTQVPFSALSYRWGELDETRSIAVIHMANRLHDGGNPQYKQQLLTVTANLEIALRGIRKTDQDIWLWVDAICINQGDLGERAQQVNIMAEIYGHAASTVVWLGMSAKDASSVPYVQALADLIKRTQMDIPDAQRNSYLIKFIQSGRIMIGEGHIDHMDMVKRVASFFRDPWFRRVWVLQEVSCTTSTVYVLANGKVPSLLWEDLVIINSYLAAAFVLLKTGTKGLVPPWQDIKTNASSTGLLPVLELFDAISHGFHATDPRDRIFSLLAIAQETHGMADLSLLIRPDYNKSNAQVFVDFTTWCIHHYRSLHVLGYVTYMDRRGVPMKGNGDLPTWALSTQPRFENRGLKLCEIEEFRAAADAELDFDLLNANPDDKSLHLRGYRLFTVTNVEKVFFWIRWDEANELYLYDEVTKTYYSGGVHWLFAGMVGPNGKRARFCEPLADNDECTGKQAFDRFLLMLTCGGWKEHGACDHNKGIHRRRQLRPAELYEMFATYWVNHGDQLADPDMELFCPHVRDILRPLAGKGGREEFMMILTNHTARKCLFVLDKGGAGLGPPEAQKDDVVVVLFGGKTPFILRPRQIAGSAGQEWEFVGECYVHDIMDGKHVENMIQRQEASEVFKLF